MIGEILRCIIGIQLEAGFIVYPYRDGILTLSNTEIRFEFHLIF
jgi:hypothetical protein